MQFLRDHNLGRESHVGKNVTVIGGGNSAIDAARTAIRLGAPSVTVVYRRTRDQMPAYAEEVAEAEREGVRILFLLGPTEVLVEQGRVAGLRCVPMALQGFDRSGRRRAVPSDEPAFVIPTDHVITAIGQKLDASALHTDLAMSRDGYVQVDPRTGETSFPWLFGGGDVATGPASVVEAVRGGERAAVAMDRLMSGAEHAFWRVHQKVDTFFDPDADPSTAPRTRLRTLPAEKRRGRFDEVELPWSEAEARREAGRCLRCDYRENCQ